MYTSVSTEDGSEPGRLLRSVWGCRLSDLAGWCSATWYGDTLVVSSSSLVGEPVESSWHLYHHPYVQCAQIWKDAVTGLSIQYAAAKITIIKTQRHISTCDAASMRAVTPESALFKLISAPPLIRTLTRSTWPKTTQISEDRMLLNLHHTSSQCNTPKNTRSTGTAHTSAKARLTSVVIQIRIHDRITTNI